MEHINKRAKCLVQLSLCLESPSKKLTWRLPKEASFSDYTIIITRSRPAGTEEESSSSDGAQNTCNGCVKETVYHVHRNILTFGERRSEYFERLFRLSCTTHEGQEMTSRIELDPACDEAFGIVLDFLYDREILITNENVFVLRDLGDYFGIQALLSLVQRHIRNDISLSNCFMYLEASENHPDFVREAADYIAENMVVIEPSLIIKLKPTLLGALVESTHLDHDVFTELWSGVPEEHFGSQMLGLSQNQQIKLFRLAFKLSKKESNDLLGRYGEEASKRRHTARKSWETTSYFGSSFRQRSFGLGHFPAPNHWVRVNGAGIDAVNGHYRLQDPENLFAYTKEGQVFWGNEMLTYALFLHDGNWHISLVTTWWTPTNTDRAARVEDLYICYEWSEIDESCDRPPLGGWTGIGCVKSPPPVVLSVSSNEFYY